MWKDSLGGLAGKPVEALGKAVRDIMRRGVLTCHPDTTVAEVARLMANARSDAAAVVDEDGEMVGLITDHEVMQRYTENLGQLTAEEIMRPKAAVVTPDTLVIEAVHIMLDRGVRDLLIKGEERREVPVGIVSAMDIVREMAGLPADRPATRTTQKKGAK